MHRGGERGRQPARPAQRGKWHCPCRALACSSVLTRNALRGHGARLVGHTDSTMLQPRDESHVSIPEHSPAFSWGRSGHRLVAVQLLAADRITAKRMAA
jgi:hypothetical protein